MGLLVELELEYLGQGFGSFRSGADDRNVMTEGDIFE